MTGTVTGTATVTVTGTEAIPSTLDARAPFVAAYRRHIVPAAQRARVVCLFHPTTARSSAWPWEGTAVRLVVKCRHDNVLGCDNDAQRHIRIDSGFGACGERVRLEERASSSAGF